MKALSRPYQAMGRTNTSKSLNTFPVSDGKVGDCLDFLTCACIFFPFETVLEEDIELSYPLAATQSKEARSTQNTVEEDKEA